LWEGHSARDINVQQKLFYEFCGICQPTADVWGAAASQAKKGKKACGAFPWEVTIWGGKQKPAKMKALPTENGAGYGMYERTKQQHGQCI